MSKQLGTIAILEDNAERRAEMQRCLATLPSPYDAVFFEDAAQMVRWLRRHGQTVHLISLDHDLPVRRDGEGRLVDAGTGQQVAEYLVSLPPSCPVIVHTSNWLAGCSMLQLLGESGWPVARLHPHDCHAWIASDWLPQVRACLESTLATPRDKA